MDCRLGTYQLQHLILIIQSEFGIECIEIRSGDGLCLGCIGESRGIHLHLLAFGINILQVLAVTESVLLYPLHR